MASVVGSGALSSTGRMGQPRPAERLHPPSLVHPVESPQALASLIEAEIIPRMLLAHRDEDTPAGFADLADADHGAAAISVLEAHAFADLVLDKDAYVLIEHVLRWRARGVPSETIMLELLAPAARRIGQYWEEDLCDFVDVTMGLWRLQEIIHELSAREPVAPAAGAPRRALFAVVPGDQHSFGVVMVEEFFRRAGWNTWSMTHGEYEDLLAMIRRNEFELVVLTVGYDRQLEGLDDLIAALRKASRNPRLRVMIGGSAVMRHPETAAGAGADAISDDPRAAIVRAENMLEMHAYPDTSRC